MIVNTKLTDFSVCANFKTNQCLLKNTRHFSFSSVIKFTVPMANLIYKKFSNWGENVAHSWWLQQPVITSYLKQTLLLFFFLPPWKKAEAINAFVYLFPFIATTSILGPNDSNVARVGVPVTFTTDLSLHLVTRRRIEQQYYCIRNDKEQIHFKNSFLPN